ncbi:hypothetical protein BDK51DRAFT_52880 [Blyttiomyces helicus]|uniref:Uncharacterized protein n=1 Tax=Blyttiomyces helicus TaxID=388810 RepID=A0A4P9W6G5_9FUNG|nr:hypothetical protein BDK51DRAFT_52880 [Blyttiomyces helicus]|eukprot:RKO85716.1 hypothetical protein BDK51DRAFT_52880 [Blyttiomyces helicus]
MSSASIVEHPHSWAGTPGPAAEPTAHEQQGPGVLALRCGARWWKTQLPEFRVTNGRQQALVLFLAARRRRLVSRAERDGQTGRSKSMGSEQEAQAWSGTAGRVAEQRAENVAQRPAKDKCTRTFDLSRLPPSFADCAHTTCPLSFVAPVEDDRWIRAPIDSLKSITAPNPTPRRQCRGLFGPKDLVPNPHSVQPLLISSALCHCHVRLATRGGPKAGRTPSPEDGLRSSLAPIAQKSKGAAEPIVIAPITDDKGPTLPANCVIDKVKGPAVATERGMDDDASVADKGPVVPTAPTVDKGNGRAASVVVTAGSFPLYTTGAVMKTGPFPRCFDNKCDRDGGAIPLVLKLRHHREAVLLTSAYHENGTLPLAQVWSHKATVEEIVAAHPVAMTVAKEQSIELEAPACEAYKQETLELIGSCA